MIIWLLYGRKRVSSISVRELKSLLESLPDDYEVVMNIHHRYDIPKEDGIKGWISYINGCHIDDNFHEVRLMN